MPRVTLTPSPSPEGRGEPETRNRRARRIDEELVPRLLRCSTYRARALRRQATPAEQALWEMLRGRRLDGAKFRRQQPLGPYFADFFCEAARLVVEVDGAHHFPAPEHDIARDALFRIAGLTVLRFPNDEVLSRPDRVLERIRAHLRSRSSPLSLRERGWG